MSTTRLESLSNPLPSYTWTPPSDAQLPVTLQVESTLYYCLTSGVCKRKVLGFSVPVTRQEGAPETVKVELSHQVLEDS